MACGVSVLQPGTEPWPRQWKPRILTTRSPRTSQVFNIFEWLKKGQYFWSIKIIDTQISFFLNLILFFKLYIIVLVLPNIKMNPPRRSDFSVHKWSLNWNAASLCSFTSCLWWLSSSSGRIEWSWQRICSSQNQNYLLSGSLHKKLVDCCCCYC